VAAVFIFAATCRRITRLTHAYVRERRDADPNRGGQWLEIRDRIFGERVKKPRDRKSNDDKDLPTAIRTRSQRGQKSRSN
jgi:hypothetical protein